METITGMAEASRGVLVRSDSRKKSSLPPFRGVEMRESSQMEPQWYAADWGLLGGKGLACGPHALHEIRMTS